eukprot:2803610-Amphidinium_carterae.1
MGGLSVPYLPTLCCLARYASLWQLQQSTDSGLSAQIADIRALPETRAHIQRKLSLALLRHQREQLLANELERHVEGFAVGTASQHMRA